MRQNFINHNGNIILASEMVIPTNNRAFRYGDSLFETMRMRHGHICCLNDHAERLSKGMKLLGYSNYSVFDAAFLERQINKLIKTNKIQESARVRFMVFRTGGGLYTPRTNDAEFLIEMEELDSIDYELNRMGINLGVFSQPTKSFNVLSPLKTGSAMPYILASIYKEQVKMDDVVLLNEQGNVIEAVSSNVFMVKNGEFFTPPISDGCISGVMRNVLIRLLKGKGYSVHELSLTPDDLEQADELFLTNAVVGVRWVVGFKRKRFFNTMSRKVVQLLNESLN